MSTNLLQRIKKGSDNPYISVITETDILNKRDQTPTAIYALNVACSGDLKGGFNSGITTIAGKSRNFKSLFALEMAKAYLSKYEDAVLVFFDSEFGEPLEYFYQFGESKNRILHAPVTSVEEFRTEIMNQLQHIERGDHVIFVLDSIGALASIKETEDALSGHNAVDMTRAKIIKSVFRLVTPQLALKNIPMVVVNHTYDTIEMFSKQMMTGGTGLLLASDSVFFIGKQQDKDGKVLVGNNFVINIEKSRFVREKEKLFVNVSFDSGIDKYSGVFDLAVELGMIENPSKGWYAWRGSDQKIRRKDIEGDDEAMQKLIDNEDFQKAVAKRFKLIYE